MATENKLKIRELYSPFSNPSGGAKDSSTLSELLYGKKSVAPAKTPTLVPNKNSIDTGLAGYLSSKGTAPAAPLAPAAPAGRGGPAAPVPAPAAPEASQVPPQWVKPDGTFYTPEEIAGNIGNTLKAASGTGDVGKLTMSEFSTAPKTTEQMTTDLRNLSALRNDIAVGETDPYGVGSKSGIAWTPEQLSAIESAQAGIYDPAINSAFSRLEAKQASDAAATEWEQKLEEMAIKHDYDLEKMEKDQEFQYGLAAYKSALDNSASVAVEGDSSLRGQPTYAKLDTLQRRQADSLNNLIRTLGEYKSFYDKNPGTLGGFVGNMAGSDSGQLATMLNSIIFAAAQAEGTGALQAADRDIIKQMIPDPTSFKGAVSSLFRGGKEANVARIENQIGKYTENLKNYGLTPSVPSTSSDNSSTTVGAKLLRSPDGQSFDASDLSPEEYQQAVADGYQPQ